MSPPSSAQDAINTLQSDPNFDGANLDWRKQKSLGSAAFRESRLPDALKHFGFAIELLPLTETEEMAKLFTNCSTTYYKISELLPEKRPSIEKSLLMAQKAVALNPKWWKGHFCAARCLMFLDKKDDALAHMKRVLEIHGDAEKDPAIADILRGLDFFKSRATNQSDLLKNNPVAPLVRFKDNVFVIDAAGTGHFRNIPEALEKHNNKVSFIVMPGVYNLDEGIKLQGALDVDIIGTISASEDDAVVLESNAAGNSNMIFVAKATLTMTNIDFRLTSSKAGGNAIRVRQAGKVALSNCKASTWSQNRPAILVMNGSLIAEKLVITHALNTGIAIMTGGFVKLRQSEMRNAKIYGIWLSGEDAFLDAQECVFSNCGQAVAATSGSKGFKLEKCTMTNLALTRLKHKCSGISLDCGSGHVTGSEFVSPGAYALVAKGVAQLEMTQCSIENCQVVGIGMTGGAEAKLNGNKIRRCEAAIAIQQNRPAKVVLDRNVIQECVDKIRTSSEDEPPIIEGPQHKIVIKAMTFDDDTRKKTAAPPSAATASAASAASGSAAAAATAAKKSSSSPAAVAAAASPDVRPKKQIPDEQKQKVVEEVKNVLNQAKPVDDYFGGGGGGGGGENSGKERRCANCQKKEDEKENKFKFCSSCRMACYCTPQCQKMGWKAHKKVCHKLADARKKVEEISTQMDKKRKELAVISDLSEKVGEAEEKAKEQLKSEA